MPGAPSACRCRAATGSRGARSDRLGHPQPLENFMRGLTRLVAISLLALLAPIPAGAAPDAGFKYVSLLVDAQGKSYFLDGEDRMTSATGASGEPLQTALVPTRKASFMRLPAGFESPWHNAPVRIYLIVLQGAMTVEAGSGERRTLRAGDVIVFADHTGAGHKSTVGAESVLFSMVEIG